jgi:CheY-like chemotaxis protein/anti-sigma regulatory factor (Ser/Thr protein kinase)
VAHILAAGRHLLGLIDEVLDIARIEAGKLSLSLEPVDMRMVLDEIRSLIRPLAEDRRVEVREESPAAGALYGLADRQRLKQVLLNLLSNAVKYNRADGSISVWCDAAPDHRLRLNVRDTGLGIPPDKVGQLFRPFERLGAAATGVSGTGLGLALSKGLMDAMGGAIGVESTPGQGNLFWVELRRAEAPEADLEALEEVEAPGRRARRGTVLYVEDNLSNLQLIERLLARQSGIKLLSAMQGRLGLDLAREHRPGLILLDLHLPDVHGSEVLRRLREDARTRDIPVVVISADASPKEIERLRAAGARDYLTKPIDVRQLLAIVDETLATDLGTRDG